MKSRSFLVILSVLVCVISYFLIFQRDITISSNNKEQPFVSKEVLPGSKSSYNLSLKLDKDEKVSVEAKIDITNISKEKWDRLVLYFIPNIFTEENSPSLDHPASVNIKDIKLNGTTSNYSLEKDTLTLPLKTQLSPNHNVNVQIDYDFKMPSKGLRFTKVGESLHLAQWYPMLPTYRNGWNKQEYQSRGETYHTPFSDFQLDVEVPPSYTIVSSSVEDDLLNNQGTKVKVKNEKEIFLALLKDSLVFDKTTSINNVNVRVFSDKERADQANEVLETAVKALDYFQKEFGSYTAKEFDVILGGLGMEYPNVVTVGSIYNSKPLDTAALRRMVVHEVAHQWFYGMVSNDPFNDAWLDEGLAEIATLLYYVDDEEEDVTFDFGDQFREELSLPVNLPINQYPNGNQSSYIYGKASLGLGMLFKKYGGEETAKNFLKTYVKEYKFKEINTNEFVRFTKHYFNLENNKDFEGWLDLNEE